MRRQTIYAALAGVTLLVGSAAAQQGQPGLSEDAAKAQQNSADEAGVKGRLEDAKNPGPPETQGAANKKLEEAAEGAKQNSATQSPSAPTPR